MGQENLLFYNDGEGYTDIPDNITSLAGAFSVEVFVRVFLASNDKPRIMSLISGAGNFTLGYTGDEKIWIRIGGVTYTTNDSPATFGVWHHIAAGVDGVGAAWIYCDGAYYATSLVGTVFNSVFSSLGAGLNTFQNKMVGLIAQARVWSDYRTQAELDDNRYVDLVGNEAGLEALWKINEGRDGTVDGGAHDVEDFTANNFHGDNVDAYWINEPEPPILSTYSRNGAAGTCAVGNVDSDHVAVVYAIKAITNPGSPTTATVNEVGRRVGNGTVTLDFTGYSGTVFGGSLQYYAPIFALVTDNLGRWSQPSQYAYPNMVDFTNGDSMTVVGSRSADGNTIYIDVTGLPANNVLFGIADFPVFGLVAAVITSDGQTPVPYPYPEESFGAVFIVWDNGQIGAIYNVTVPPNGAQILPDAPSLDGASNDGTGTSITLTLTPPAAGGYEECTIYYRLVGASAWTEDGAYVGAQGVQGTHQVTGLENNRYYEFIVIAINGDYVSLPSITLRAFCTDSTSVGYEIPLQQAIYNHLAADSNVMDLIQGIYDNPIQVVDPESAGDFPYITIGEATHIPWDTDNTTGIEARAVIHVWSREQHRLEVKEIQDAVYYSLHRAEQDITIVNKDVVGCDMIQSQTIKEPDGVTIHGIQEFTFWLEDAE